MNDVIQLLLIICYIITRSVNAFQSFSRNSIPKSFPSARSLSITNEVDSEENFNPNKSVTEGIEENYPPDRLIDESALSPLNNKPYRSGFISIIGAPNMGKSTLFNALLSYKLCTVTPRPQTTRHSILGVLTSPATDQFCQLCFWDTPGVIGDPAYKLQEGMMESVKGAFRDSDIILVVADLFTTVIPDDVLFQKVQQSDKTVIVALNKIDMAGEEEEENPNRDGSVDEESNGVYTDSRINNSHRRTARITSAVKKWRDLLPNALAIIPLIASNGGDDKGVVALRTLLVGGPDVPNAFRNLGRPISGIFRPGVKFVTNEEAREILPVGPQLYEADTLTDRSERFFASEIIRGSLFFNLGKELPYCCEVRIVEFREPRPYDKKKITRIAADICVERDSQKGMVVGKKGQKIKDVGADARKELEEFLQQQVYLTLNVKVDKNWRKDESRLKEYGYIQ